MEEITKSEKDIGLLVYASSFAGYLVPLGSVLGPLIVWLMKREDSAFVDQCGRNCLNFKLSVLVYFVISAILAFVGIGFILLGILAVMDIICTIIGIIKASEGTVYRFPLTITFLSTSD